MNEAPPVRLARVVTRLNVGGPTRHIAILGGRLGPEFQSVVLAGAQGEREGSQEWLVVEEGAKVLHVPGLRREISPGADLRALYWLFRYFRRTRPAIVHTHMAKAGAVGRVAAFVAGVPIRVHTFHGHVLEGFFGTRTSFLFKLIERGLARITTRFVAISPEIAEDIARLQIGVGKTSIVRLGLDLEDFAKGERGRLRTELSVPADRPLVGVVARLVPSKNHRLFLEAARLVRQVVPEAEFVIPGDGQLWEALQAEAAALGLAEVVHFLGWREDLDSIYPDLDVVVCSSISEGTSVSIIQAGAAGRPVVSTRVGGMADIIHDGINGYLVPSGDAPALADAIVRLLVNPETARRMGQEGQRMALARYGADRLVRDLKDLYNELLERR